MKKILFSIVVAIVAVLGFTSCESYGVVVSEPVYPYRTYYSVYPYRTYYYYSPYNSYYYRQTPPPPPRHRRHHRR
jgi:hypothetical protein